MEPGFRNSSKFCHVGGAASQALGRSSGCFPVHEQRARSEMQRVFLVLVGTGERARAITAAGQFSFSFLAGFTAQPWNPLLALVGKVRELAELFHGKPAGTWQSWKVLGSQQETPKNSNWHFAMCCRTKWLINALCQSVHPALPIL